MNMKSAVSWTQGRNMLSLINMLHPKYIRYAKQALLFGIVWMLFGFLYSILEKGILGRLDYYPSTNNRYDFRSALFYASGGGFLMGLIHGWVEVSWLSKKLQRNALWVKVLLKTTFYLLFSILFLVALSTSVNAYRFGTEPFSEEVVQSLRQFVWTFSFWSVVIYVAFGLTIAMLFSELSTYLGNDVFLNFLFGKYHVPRQETRIFMFLDMKSSTTTAERIGHARYFELLRACYADMANPILETEGEIYQYVGDEIVISWTQRAGLKQHNCLECFNRIQKSLDEHSAYYQRRFDLLPVFKAGMHIGKVTSGEIGSIKKEIIYTGDVLNTAARIQSECNTYQETILISESLVKLMKESEYYRFRKVAQLQLRGKKQAMTLYALQ
ncbi:MAG: adenylate/guanylate cyclase domain-containing protein [Bacteroidota bacterium]